MDIEVKSIKEALQVIGEIVEDNKTVATVRVSITFKPKPSKADES